MLHRHLCLADPARKSWEAILGSRYFGPAKVVKEGVSKFQHSTARAKNLRLAATWPTGCKSRKKQRQRVSKMAAFVPEMSVVK